MDPIDDSNTTILTQLVQLMKELYSLPECKNTSKNMYSNLVRKMKLLSPLFEELVDRGDDQLAVDEVRALQKLWVALDSAKELLEWVNEASKLYQAVHWDRISLKFLNTTEQIEEALNSIPYDKLNLSEEVREQIELVHAQFRRAKCKMDSPDPQQETDLAVVQKEVDPDVSVLQRLSQSLQLRTIDDLRVESRTFHEMVITNGADLGYSFEMMSSLFKKLNDYLLTKNPEIDTPEDVIKHRCPVIPDDFRCPISLELMNDPVIVSTGQTYERSCIKKWIDAGHKTCPKTHQTLLHTALTPNYALKSLITLWCESNGIELPKNQGNSTNKRSGTGSSECDRAAINGLLRKLIHGNTKEQRAAAGELRLLAKRNADNRVCIAEAGAIPLLIELLSSPDSRTQEHAVTALLNLSIYEMNKSIIVDAGAIPDIVEVLKNGSMEARENAAATLFSLSEKDENKVAIGAAGAIPALIDLLCDGTPRGKKDAATAIFNLSIYQGNKVRAVRAGIVPLLMRLLKDPGSGMVDEALAILAILARHPEVKVAEGESDPIPVLMEIIRTGSPRNRENAVAVLLPLCVRDTKHLKIAREFGVDAALKELSENGTERARRKATNLLELLQQVDT
ncbi:hypothetical protein Nepgr_001264 [Nepenthes gracilis]|uniref:U-box domain-containing protein 12 n=1 Tax=Nepenthes gracilis TaxID=150966 RepID=A0AAD3P5Q8_NEPGR|nr:hypothetical protein Nepgr_001264 [Nepenthes gracilis]